MGHRRKTSPVRKSRQRSDSYFTRAQVYSIYTLYRKGYSVPTLAAQLWRRYGFVSKNSCQTCIYEAFSSYKFRMRQPNESKLLGRQCSNCGCSLDSRTRGCDSCKSRHYWRRKKLRQQYQLSQLSQQAQLDISV